MPYKRSLYVAEPAEEAWKTDFEPTMIQVLAGSPPITFETHSAVYSAAHNYVSSSRSKPGVNPCPDLYGQVKLFFAQYTERIGAAAPDDDAIVPAYYDAEWDRFSRGVKVVDRLLEPLNKHFVNRARDTGTKDLLTVRNLAFDGWKKNVFERLLLRLENADSIDKARLEMIRSCFAAEELNNEDLQNMRLGAVPVS
ncbi:hypothetical protein B0H14DRAFT_2906021 [Mycena olivaceomarginata]|nr:hypothetical protein B0H14DRAFT_2906021 [Mycena olivaceomarginata]